MVCNHSVTTLSTLEGIIVSLLTESLPNHDIDDAIRAGVLSPDDIPRELTDVLGSTNRATQFTAVIDASSWRSASYIWQQ